MPDSSSLTYVDKTGSVDALVEHINCAVNDGAQSILLLVSESLQLTPENFDNILVNVPIPICGGVFPQLIENTEHFKDGSIVVGLPFKISICNITGLSDSTPNFISQMDTFADFVTSESALLIFFDGSCTQLNFFLEECFGLFGSDHQYIGGGAGTLGLKDKPCLFSNQGMLKQCAQVISMTKTMATEITHGWDKLDGPFLVTAAEQNKVHALDFRPAFEVYRDVIKNLTGEIAPDRGLFSVSQNYPIGLSQINGQVVVRDPISTKNGSLLCVGEVPENHVIYILKGKSNNLIGASKAAARSLASIGSLSEEHPAIAFDCISRLMYLGDRFDEELTHIHASMSSTKGVIGALTIGEVSCSGDTCLQLYNKSLVIGAFLNE